MKPLGFQSCLSSICFVFLFLIFQDVAVGDKTIGAVATSELSKAFDESSDNLKSVIRNSVIQLDKIIDKAYLAIKNCLKTFSQSVDKSELKQKIQSETNKLMNIKNKLTNYDNLGVQETNYVWQESICATKNTSGAIFNAAGAALQRIPGSPDTSKALKEIQRIAEDFSTSVDNVNAEFKTNLSSLANRIEEVFKSFNGKVDSGGVNSMEKEAHRDLVKSAKELSNSWELALNTADLKDAGAGATAELAKALENLSGKVEIDLAIDSNMRIAIEYCSVAVGIALLVALLVLGGVSKSCGSGISKSISSIGSAISKIGRAIPAKTAENKVEQEDDHEENDLESGRRVNKSSTVRERNSNRNRNDNRLNNQPNDNRNGQSEDRFSIEDETGEGNEDDTAQLLANNI